MTGNDSDDRGEAAREGAERATVPACASPEHACPARQARATEAPFRVLCVVPLFHPSPATWNRWLAWAPHVDCLMLFDNTPPGTPPLRPVEELPENLTYWAADANRGVAAAFNHGARIARQEGYTHLMTCDQDSEPPADLACTLYRALSREAWVQTGLIGPVHSREDMTLVARKGTSQVDGLMSSGCLVNLAAWQAVGGYNEAFFMDHVDSDFCLRLRRAGYQVIRCNQVVMPHRLGASRVHVLLGRRFLVNHHPPARRYTMARNTVGLCCLYGRDFPGLRRRQARELTGLAIKILLFERRKGAQLIAIMRGLWDGFRGRQSLEQAHADSPHADP